jgi:O-antigen ligase
VSLILAGCLPFLVLFDTSRNIDLQGLILIVAGGFAWLNLVLSSTVSKRQLASLPTLSLGLFMVSCVLSVLVHPHLGYDLLGAPYIRLGTLGLLSCLGCGLVVSRLSPQRLITYLYIGISSCAILSIPYSLLRFHSLLRIGGLFAQADIFAVFVGCGLLLGARLLRLYPRWRYYCFASQGLLGGLLLLSQTRSVLFLLLLIYPLWRRWSVRKWLLYAGIVVALLISAQFLLPSRLTNVDYANQSISYRLDLQHAALDAGFKKPLFGYGPGNLADALDCRRLRAAALQKTCQQGYFFNSSHNIFLDRVLAIGWLGGLSYLVFVIMMVGRGLWSSSDNHRLLACCALLIAGYYCTNVTSVCLELLLWVLLLQLWTVRSDGKRGAH